MDPTELLERLEEIANDKFGGYFTIQKFWGSWAISMGQRAKPGTSAEGATFSEAGLAMLLAIEQNKTNLTIGGHGEGIHYDPPGASGARPGMSGAAQMAMPVGKR